MHFLYLIIMGLISGVFAGMGMGGGTFLVPLLSVFFGIEQIVCQSTNVLCFVVLAIFCLVIYTKNKLVNYWVVLCVGLPAVIVSVMSCLFALKIKSHILHLVFAGFIILVGIYFLIESIVLLVKKKR